ncbi:hypothetical protein FRC00_002091 [Tulasnella sp. 408]|nr:hypothetical protein FRC00_002091 [Tulasnella sp. 408]
MKIDAPKVHLPPGRDVVDVFGDFLKYMYDCVKIHILGTRIDGNALWSSLGGTAHFILSHPNGWGSYQQGKMREAAIRGGLVPNTPEGRERIEFVTEGEASFHWCIEQALTGTTLKPLGRDENRRSRPGRGHHRCVFVSRQNTKTTPAPGADGTSINEGYIETLREDFDEDAKCLFRAIEEGGDDVYTVRIGGRGDDFEDENGLCSIELGYLNVDREDIAAAFEPSVVATVDAIRKHIAGRRDTVGVHVFLVGGFAASPWILSETKRRLSANGSTCEVKRADSNTAKAVAHGGVAFYLDRNVTERTMRHTYGVSLRPWFNPSNPEHQARSHASEKDPISGITYLDGGFFALVKKGQVVEVDSVYRKSVRSKARRAPEIDIWIQSIKRYNGTRDNIAFVDMDRA